MEKRKWLSLLLAVTMLFTSIPVGMFAEGEDPVVEETATVEEVTIEEPAPAPEVKEEPAPAPAPEKKEEPAPAPEKKEEPAPVVEEKEEPAPVVEEKEEPAPVVEEKEEPAPVVEEKEEPAPSDGGETVPTEGTEPAAEPVVTEDGEPEGDAVPEETGTEPAEDVTPVVEPEPVPEVEEVEEETEAFKAGLAYLSSGEVFEDKQLQKAYGTVNSKAVVYATDRITGEGELSGSDVIRISANIEGQEKALYVKNGRLTYLSEDETADYNDEKHEEGIACRGTKLDPVSFTPAAKPETEAEPTEEPVPTEPTGEEPTEEPMPTEPTGEEPTEEPVPTEPTGEEPTEEPVPTEPTGEEPTEEPVPTEPTGEEPTEEPAPSEPTGEEPTEEPVPTEPTGEEPTEEPVPTEPTGEEPTDEPVPTEPTGEEPTEEPVPTEPTGEEPTDEPVPTEPMGEEPTETPVNTEDATGNDDSDDDLTVIDITDLIHPDTNASETTDEEAGLESTTSSDPTDDTAEEVVESLEDSDEEVLGTEDGEENTDISAEGDGSEEIIVEDLEVRSGAWNDAPVLSATANGTTITLSWVHEAGSEAYAIYEVVDGSNVYRKQVSTKSTVIADVAVGTHVYNVQPRQKNDAGKWQYGERSANVTVETNEPVAVWSDAPVLTVTAEGTTVTLSWVHEAGSEAYAIYEVVDGSNVYRKQVSTKSTVIADVAVGTHVYNVQPRQKNDAGKWQYGARSEDVTVVVSEPVPVWSDAPVLTVTAEGTTVTLSWEHEAGSEAYAVYEVVDGSNVYRKQVSTKSTVIADVAVGTHVYNVQPRQKNDAGKWQYGARSENVTVVVSEPVAVWSDAPVLTVTAEGTTVTLSWVHEAGSEAYAIYEVVDGSNVYRKQVSTKSTVIADVAVGTHVYNVQPRQKNDAGKWQYGARSEDVTVVVSEPVPVWSDAPVLTVTAEGTTVTLSWEHDAGSEAYAIYEVVDGSNVYRKQVSTKSTVIADVAVGTHVYNVQPRQKNDAGKWQYGERSANVMVVVSEPVAVWSDAPVLTVTAEGTTVTLSWVHEAGSEAYAIYEVVDGSNVYRKQVSTKSTVIADVAVGTHVYNVQPRQKNDAGKWQYGARSEDVTVVVSEPVPVWSDAPVLTVTAEGTTVTLSWVSEVEAEAYGIYEIVDGSNVYRKIVYGNGTTLTGVEPGEHEYYVQPRQKNDAGKWQYGDVSNSVSIVVSTAIIINDVVYEHITDTTIRVVDYLGSATSVIIPEVVDGATVTEIGPNSFEGNATLQSIDLPDTITVIGRRAFADCISLSEMR